MPKFMVKVNTDYILVLSGKNETEVKEKSLMLMEKLVEAVKETDATIKLEVNRYPSATELPEETK